MWTAQAVRQHLAGASIRGGLAGAVPRLLGLSVKVKCKGVHGHAALLFTAFCVPFPFYITLSPIGPKPNNVSLVRTTNSSIVVACSVPPQLQFVNNITEWKVTLQREGFAKTFIATPFTATTTQLTVNHLLPATRYTVSVSVMVGNAEGPLSESFNVTTQEEGET